MFAVTKETQKQAQVSALLNFRAAQDKTKGIGPAGHLSSSTNFHQQRYLGNSYLQSYTSNQKPLKQTTHQTGIPVIQRKCTCGASCNCGGKEDETKIQTRPKIGPVDDVYEREADRIADRVLNMSDSSIPIEQDQTSAIEGLQRVRTGSNRISESSPDIQLNLSGGRPLSPATRRFMEPRFGADFGHVRLHTNQQAQQTASQIQARAFTYSNHIWLGKGAGEQNRNLMAHELVHVIQQNGQNRTNKGLIQRFVESTEPNSPLWEGVKDVGSVLSPAFGLGRGVLAADCLMDLEGPMGQITFDRWIPHACARSPSGYLHSREWDAFGHCWIACEGSRQCGRGPTAAAGTVREVYREIEDTLGGDPHDSFSQDVNNQAHGRELSFTAGTCYSLCDNAHMIGTLDLSAPRRVCANCATYPASGSEGPCP